MENTINRRLLFIILTLLFYSIDCSPSNAQAIDSLFFKTKVGSDFNIKGPVQSMELYAEILPAALQTNTELNTLTLPGMELYSVAQYQFDSLGRLIFARTTPLNLNKKKPEETATYYSPIDRRLSSIVNKIGEKTMDSIVFEYGRYQRLSGYTAYNSRKKLSHRVAYSYNSNQQVTAIRKRTIEEYPLETIKLYYDAEGMLTTEQYYDEDMNHLYSVQYNLHTDSDYSSNETILKKDAADKLTEGIMQARNEYGKISEKSTIDSQRRVTSYTRYKYNEWGDLDWASYSDSVTNVEINIEYKYDDYKNWTEKRIKTGSRLAQISTRKINYYLNPKKD
jgi:hypothetical protein